VPRNVSSPTKASHARPSHSVGRPRFAGIPVWWQGAMAALHLVCQESAERKVAAARLQSGSPTHARAFTLLGARLHGCCSDTT